MLFTLKKSPSQSIQSLPTDKNHRNINYFLTLFTGCIGLLLCLGTGSGMAVTLNNAINNATTNNTTTNNATTNSTTQPVPIKPLAPIIKTKSNHYSVTVGNSITVNLSAIDSNNDLIRLLSTDLPADAVLIITSSIKGSSSASLEWTPTVAQIGLHTITLTASDGNLISSKKIKILVRPPTAKNIMFAPASAPFNPNADLYFYFKLNGNTQDSSGNNRHARDSDMHYEMSGLNHFGKFSNGSTVHLGSNTHKDAITIALWFSVDTLTEADLGLFTLYNDGAFVTIDHGEIYYHFQPDYAYPDQILSLGNINDKEWHHLVISWDGSYIRSYIDGKVAGNGEQTFMRHRDGPAEYGIGSTLFPHVYPAGPTSGSFKGNIDEVMLYTRALNFQEITSLFNSQANNYGAPSNLTATSDAINRVNLQWNDNTLTEDGFTINRGPSLNPATHTRIATVGPNTVMYSNTTGLSPNSWYYYRIGAFNTANNMNYYSNPILIKTATNTSPITVPATFNLRAISSTAIELEWADSSNNEDGFIIEKSSSSAGPWSLLANVPARRGIYLNGFITYDNGLTANTRYYYRVRAYNLLAQSANKSANTLTLRTGESAPANLFSEPISANQINLQWEDTSSTETGYRVQRSTDGTTWTTLAGTLPINSTSYSAVSLTDSTTYYFRIFATFASGTNAYSRSVQDTTFLATPTGLTATATSFEQINLAFTDNSTNEEGYNIYSSQDGENWSWFTAIDPNIQTYSNTYLNPETTYYYYVQAFNDTSSQVSLPSNIVSATTPAFSMPSPSGLAAAAPSYNQINLTWADNSSVEYGFKIEQSEDGSIWEYAGEVAANIENYSVLSLDPDTLYYFRVKAFHPFGDATSNIISKRTPHAINPPSSLTASVFSYQQINLSWADNSNNEGGFNIEVSQDGNTWSPYGNVAPNIKNFSVTGLEQDTPYYFRVEAYHSQLSYSSFSNIATARTPFAVIPPSDLRATVISYQQINLSWTNNANNHEGFTVEMSNNGTVWFPIESVGPSVRNYSATELEPQTLYYFRIQAFDDATGLHSNSNTVSITTAAFSMAAPSNLTVQAVSSSEINLTWRDNSNNEEGFNIEISNNGVTWESLDTTFSDEESYSASSLNPNTLYYFRVQALNSTYDVTSGNSNTASVKTFP